MGRDEGIAAAAAVDEARRASQARREAMLALSNSERLQLVAELCLQSAALPQHRPRS